MMSHDWPGNVRELKTMAERYVLSSLPPEERIPKLMAVKSGAENTSAVTLKEQVSLFERHLIKESLKRNDGIVKDVIDDLGIPRRTLNEKMAKYGLKRS